MTNVKTISIAVLIIGALIGTYEINTIAYSFARNVGEIPIVGGICPEGHNCSCIPSTGDFFDLTAHTHVIRKPGCNGIGGGNNTK